jgi:uncharacterized membrane-anchored protein YhcB (DUF1043 family)
VTLKEKIISIGKSIGIAILGFIAAFVIEKLFSHTENKKEKQEEEIKDSLDNIKEKLGEAKDKVTEQGDIIADIKRDIKKYESVKDEIVDFSIEKRIEDAHDAGFKEG